MSDDPVIEVRDVWRRYRIASGGRSATLRGMLARGPGARASEWFWALQGVDVDVRPGRATAIIGPNGAGKSTLLRLAGGIGRPDRGSVRTQGRIGAMLDLGRELHPDLTGRQNAELAAVVAGLTRREFRRRFDEMLDFAGLHAFADQPLHAYSDGMRARLAFSVLSHVDADVLLVDEVLAVGDAAFQERSVARIDDLRRRGTAVLFVSHDLHLVRRVCDEAIWLEGGVARQSGDAVAVTGAYLAHAHAAPAPPGAGPVPTDGTGPAGDGPEPGGAVLAAAVLDPWGEPLRGLRVGGPLRVSASVAADPQGRRRRLSVVLRGEADERDAVDTSTVLSADAEDLAVTFHRLDLAPGRYEVIVSVFDHGWTARLGEHRTPVDVHGEGPDGAALAPPHEWTRHHPS